MTDNILEVRDLEKHFPVKTQFLQRMLSQSKPVVHAVDGVSFTLRRGEIFGLVGESGCGKTTLGRTVLRLLKPTAGQILFEGIDITNLPTLEEHFVTDFFARQFGRLVRDARRGPLSVKKVRDAELLWSLRRSMQIIFQDPHAALNPAMTIGQSITDPLLLHKLATPKEARRVALEIMTEVGLSPADQLFMKYPADLSGGQKQRAVFARAMILRPSFIVADEPVAMLDMSVRARILELMLNLKRRHGLTYLYITHDLATAKLICDRIAIMYLGKFAEVGETKAIYQDPKHPYTKALLAAIPNPDPDRRRSKALPSGEVPDAIYPPLGCRFHPRCPVATPACGWEARDVIDFLEGRALQPDTAAEDEKALGPLVRLRAEGLRLRIPSGTENAEEIERQVIRLRAQMPTPMAEAIRRISTDRGDLILEFAPADDPGMRTHEDRDVRCVLY